jgi:TolB-like protein/Flp pilus assembly protein TadD
MNASNFFAELKRRNVYKVAVAYIVAGWALSQGIAQVFPVFDVPNWAIRSVVLLIILGLPIALILAWMFELTPQGIKRTETADAMPAAAHHKKRAWIYVVVIGGVLSIGLFSLGRYSAGTRQSQSSALPAKSIAVLPFDNLSRDPNNAYFAEGIQDEILTRLAKVADLKVISHTSTQRFKSAPEDLRQIAKQLGVMNILEGSVQKAADQVRVNVQLINGLTDAHLWAETYDRKLTDIFAVESDIANTIADTLQAKITSSEKTEIAKRPTANSEAYEFYLKGRFFWNKRTGNDLKKSIDYFNQAIAKDPGYALAYAGLADAYVLLSGYAGARPGDAFPKAKAAAQKALELDNNLAEAHTSLAETLAIYDYDFTRAIAEFKRAIELNPNYATAHHWYGNGPLMTLGRSDEAITEGKRSVELDPLSIINNADLGQNYYMAHRFDEAIDQLHKTIEMEPGFYYAHSYLGQALQAKGDLAGAIAEYQKAHELNDDPFSLGLLGNAYAISGKTAEALKILVQLEQISKQRYVAAYSFALVHLGLGHKDEALRWLEKSYEDRAGFDVVSIPHDPLLNALHGDPRFQALVEKIVPSGAK